jgi:hypothetical protein
VVVTRSYDTRNWFELADLAIDYLSRFQIEDDGDDQTDTNAKALENSRRIDDYFETARQFCVGLEGAFSPFQEERTSEYWQVRVGEVLARVHEADISQLESSIPVADETEFIDMCISELNRSIGYALWPGVSFDKLKRTEFIQPKIQPVEFFNISAGDTQEFMPQIVFLNQRLRLLCSYAPKLREIIKGGGDGIVYRETLESLRLLWNYNDPSRSVIGRRHLMERQLWRLLDLRDSGGFGFLVELFFLVLPQLLPMAPSNDAHSVLYIGTLKAITSSWRAHKHSIGTQRVILNLICDIANPDRGVITDRAYPEYITNELLVLLGNMVVGQSGSHIHDTMLELGTLSLTSVHTFRHKAMAVIHRRRA